MKTFPWKNKTHLHPKGVCEAATSTWLVTIAQSGVDEASKLTPEQCDSLQSKVESTEYTWALGLLEKLTAVHAEARFNAFEGPTFKKSGVDDKSIKQTIDELPVGWFIYVSATNKDGDGHALAIYKEGDSAIHLFDPNNAMYVGDSLAIANQLSECVATWADVVGRIGQFK